MFKFKQDLILHPVSKMGNGVAVTSMGAILAQQKDSDPPCYQGPNIFPQKAYHHNAELRITNFLKGTLEFGLILQ